MSETDETPRPLPGFPVDDFTLDQLEHALNTCVDGPVSMPFAEVHDEAPRTLVGGEFTLSQFLDFMSGHDPARKTLIGDADGIPIYECWDPQYSEHDVLRALVAEIRRLRLASGEVVDALLGAEEILEVLHLRGTRGVEQECSAGRVAEVLHRVRVAKKRCAQAMT